MRRPWGRSGEVAITLNSGNSGPGTPIRPGWTVYLDGVAHTVAGIHGAGRGAMALRLREVASQHLANQLRGAMIEVDSADLPAPPDGTYYEYQVLGLTAKATDGRVLGRVSEIIVTGANDVYVVQPPGAQSQEILVPALKDVVTEIDIEAGTMTVDLPEGLT